MQHHGKECSQLVFLACDIVGKVLKLSSEAASLVGSANAGGCSSSMELRMLLQDPTKPDDMYPLFLPVLFAGRNCENIGGLFQIEGLMMVCC
jgi:hypothetical protein